MLESSAGLAIVLDYVRRHVAHCLHCSFGDVTEAQSLIGLGTDSLAGFALMGGGAIPIAELLTRNIEQIAELIVERVAPKSKELRSCLPVQSTALVG